MENEYCPKCNVKRTPGKEECHSCGVIFAKAAAAKNKAHNKPLKKAVPKPGLGFKKKAEAKAYTSSARINKQLYRLGAIDTWFTKKEIKHLPEMIRSDETIKGLGSGLLDGNTWLIVVTNQRLLFLDKGMLFGLKQAEMHYEQISSISYKKGLLLSSIKISTSGGEKEIKHVEKTDAPRLTELISKLMREAKQPTQKTKQPIPVNPAGALDVISQLERLGELLAKGILTEEEFKTQKAKLLA